MDQDAIERLSAMLRYENESIAQGYTCIAGVDEAGRGPLAGPVVAAACILPQGYDLSGINDSKQLKPSLRRHLYETLIQDPRVYYAVGIVEPSIIDQINILQATYIAMEIAIDQLKIKPDFILIDGKIKLNISIPYLSIIKGDSLSLSIAAASIIAKETRDDLMLQIHQEWPDYGFNKHMGYGTAKHMEAIAKYGILPIHRKSFEPIKSLVENNKNN